jgi:hypothetical protein
VMHCVASARWGGGGVENFFVDLKIVKGPPLDSNYIKKVAIVLRNGSAIGFGSENIK